MTLSASLCVHWYVVVAYVVILMQQERLFVRSDDTKTCTICNKELPCHNFRYGNRRCKRCYAELYSDRYKKRRDPDGVLSRHTHCQVCDRDDLPLIISRSPGNANGAVVCRPCNHALSIMSNIRLASRILKIVNRGAVNEILSSMQQRQK